LSSGSRRPQSPKGGPRAARTGARVLRSRSRRYLSHLVWWQRKRDNVRTLMAQPEIDGVLVGGASLDANSFASTAPRPQYRVRVPLDTGTKRIVYINRVECHARH